MRAFAHDEWQTSVVLAAACPNTGLAATPVWSSSASHSHPSPAPLPASSSADGTSNLITADVLGLARPRSSQASARLRQTGHGAAIVYIHALLIALTLSCCCDPWIDFRYIDRHGGYSNASGTLGRCCWFDAAATLFSIPAAFTSNMWVIQAALWWVLFFGGALLSPATGVCINAVSPELRAFSSALSMFAYNIFG